MITVNVIGRLGLDAEVKETKGGTKYVTLRLATDEYRNGKTETAWLNIYDYSERALKMVQYWKKGSLLNVCGSESVSVYQSKQTGEWLPSRDIRAFSIDFVNSGTSGNTQTTTDTATSASVSDITTDCGVLNPPTTQIPSMSTVNNDDDDGLPF